MDPYLVSIVSAIAMATVYLIDMAMVGDTYTRPSQAMLVSSLAGILPAPLLLLLGWQMPSLAAALMALCAGIVLMSANWIYFDVVFSDAGEATEVAAFDSGSVFLVAIATALLPRVGIALPDTVLFSQWIGVLIGAFALLGLSVWGDRMEFVTWKHRTMLMAFMALGAGYELLSDFSLSLTGIEDRIAAYVSVTPFFWIGLSTGVVAILPKAERNALKENWANIVEHWKPIVAAELVALVAFATALLGFSGGHVAIVSLLAGSAPVIVFIGGILLRRYFRLYTPFPSVRHPRKKALMIVLIISAAALAWG